MTASALQQLSAVEQCLEAAPQPSAADAWTAVARWLQETSERLRECALSEQGLAAYIRLLVQLTQDGILAQTDDGKRRRYEERKALVLDLGAQLEQALGVAQQRLAKRVRALEDLAEAAIRAAAQAQLLSAPGAHNRMEWLASMARRMADHPHSAPPIARLGLCVADPDLYALLDRVLQRVFGV